MEKTQRQKRLSHSRGGGLLELGVLAVTAVELSHDLAGGGDAVALLRVGIYLPAIESMCWVGRGDAGRLQQRSRRLGAERVGATVAGAGSGGCDGGVVWMERVLQQKKMITLHISFAGGFQLHF